MEAATTKSKVLIIDDDPSFCRFSQAVFETQGFEVSVASEGTGGIQQALNNPPQIIILDIMMQGLHGFEVCRMLRTHTSMRRTAIIVTSGKSYKADIDKAMELGADAYVVKPFSPKELVKIATEHMNKRASQP